jgi:histidinol-phosphate aminotransferase
MQASSPYTVHVRPELDCMPEYVPGESPEAFHMRTGIPIDKLIKLNSNESPYGPSPAVLAALRKFGWYNNYPDANATALRAELSFYTGLDERFIVLGHGSMELISLLWQIFLSKGDTILCCPPTFSLYATETTLCGASVQEVARLPGYALDVPGVLAALTPRTKLIVLCSPNNPTGNPIDEGDLLALLESGRIVIVDEAYVEFSDQARGFAHLVPRYRNLIVLRTFSKWAGLAGLRIGYGLFPEWIAAYMRRAQCPFEVNIAGHIAAIATLQDLPHVLGNVRKIVQERARLFQVLARQPYLEPVPSQGNYILAHVSCAKHISLARIRDTVEAHGILLRYFGTPDLHNFLRVTVGLPEQTDSLALALDSVHREAAGRQ